MTEDRSKTTLESTTSHPHQGERGSELIKLWRVFVKYKKTIYSIFSITLITSLLYALISTPIYRAELMMVTADEEQSSLFGSGGMGGNLGGLASLAGIAVNSTSQNVNTALAILGSRSFTEEYIVEKNLMPILFDHKWDEEKLVWKTNSFFPIFKDQKPPTLSDGYRKFKKTGGGKV